MPQAACYSMTFMPVALIENSEWVLAGSRCTARELCSCSVRRQRALKICAIANLLQIKSLFFDCKAGNNEKLLVGRAGVEPTTNGLKVRCSTN